MAMAAMRSELHIIKFKSHPTGELRSCAICAEEVNNTAHVLLHCPISLYIWDITGDLLKIITGIKLRIDPKLKLLNFTEQLVHSKSNKLLNKFVNNILVINKRIIFFIYYRGDGAIKGADILDEFRKKFRLTIDLCVRMLFS